MNDNYFFSSMDTSERGLNVALFKDWDDFSLGDSYVQTDLSVKLRGK